MATAARNVTLHLNGEHRTFMEGEFVPDEWAATVQSPAVLGENVPEPEPDEDEDDEGEGSGEPSGDLAGWEKVAGGNMEPIIDWVTSADGDTVVVRAEHALIDERSGKNRPKLIDALTELIDG